MEKVLSIVENQNCWAGWLENMSLWYKKSECFVVSLEIFNNINDISIWVEVCLDKINGNEMLVQFILGKRKGNIPDLQLLPIFMV